MSSTAKISDKDHIKRIIKMPVNFLVKSGKGFFFEKGRFSAGIKG